MLVSLWLENQRHPIIDRPQLGASVGFIAYADMGTTAAPAAFGTALNVLRDVCLNDDAA